MGWGQCKDAPLAYYGRGSFKLCYFIECWLEKRPPVLKVTKGTVITELCGWGLGCQGWRTPLVGVTKGNGSDIMIGCTRFFSFFFSS